MTLGADVPGGDGLVGGILDDGRLDDAPLSARDIASLAQIGGPVGTIYCSPALPTSTGLPARIGAEGSLRVSENDLTLIAEDLPPGEFGYFFGGETQGMAMPFGSDGIICLAGVIARFSQPQQIVQGPTAAIPIDLTSIPTSPPVAVAPGDTWNFQCWFRDGVSSNFTDALSITFQ